MPKQGFSTVKQSGTEAWLSGSHLMMQVRGSHCSEAWCGRQARLESLLVSMVRSEVPCLRSFSCKQAETLRDRAFRLPRCPGFLEQKDFQSSSQLARLHSNTSHHKYPTHGRRRLHSSLALASEDTVWATEIVYTKLFLCQKPNEL